MKQLGNSFWFYFFFHFPMKVGGGHIHSSRRGKITSPHMLMTALQDTMKLHIL